MNRLIEKLARERHLEPEEYVRLIDGRTPETAAQLAELASVCRRRIYGTAVFIRGLIEIGNICKNDCLYCGIRRSNSDCRRYRLEPEEILACAKAGYALGFRTIVLQGGEDPYYTDELLCGLIGSILRACPGAAVTLSLGERGRESFRHLFEAGAARYLLRHETADRGHYEKLHPKEMSFDHRIQCLYDLREIGFQVGCGSMVGSPHQTTRNIAEDLLFIERFQPDMCGIGPFIPHHGMPFRSRPAGSAELTCFLLSVIRLIAPPVLLPATTALGTIDPAGREKGILAGANVIMPNLSPTAVRKDYELYDNKLTPDTDSARHLAELAARMRSIGYELVTDRGDVRK